MNRKLDTAIAESRRRAEERGHSYREKALKMFPWVCGRCSREFTRKNLSELTVHHRDHNHDNNPEDGSNWELLCLYCHDNEHSRYLDAPGVNTSGADELRDHGGTSRPFENLREILKKKQ